MQLTNQLSAQLLEGAALVAQLCVLPLVLLDLGVLARSKRLRMQSLASGSCSTMPGNAIFSSPHIGHLS